MPNCTSCGERIPEGQGGSCSMCYGDIAHGRDGYYEQEEEQWRRVVEEQASQEEYRREE